MRTNWSNMDYSFSVIRAFMWLFGVWPFQRNEFLCTTRWLAIVMIHFLALFTVLMENFQNCNGQGDKLEILILSEGCIHGLISCVFPRIYMKRMAVNISSAMEDWSCLCTEKNSRMIMMGYARVGQKIVLSNGVIFIMNFVTYLMILVDNKQQVIIANNDTVTLWNLPIATCLFREVSYRTYTALFALQMLQLVIINFAECINDSFFFCITMHLCGQLELLRNRFVEIKKEIDVKNGCKNKLEPLIRRHYQLITLAENIEDSFNLNILMRFIIISLVIAASGIRLIALVQIQNYNEIMKMIFFIQFYILQCFLFTHAGETLHNQSTLIISAIYNTKWYELPSNTMKDLILIMMRLKTPLRLSAGKFFYLTRSTMTDIFTTTMSYISFLRMSMEE